MGKRALAAVVAIFVCVLLLPNAAMAATITDATIDCTAFSGDMSDAGWSWNHATKTLTVSDLRIELDGSTGQPAYGIKLPDGATLNLSQDVLDIFFDLDGSGVTYGIGVHCAGNLIIDGGGGLGVIQASKNYGDHCAVSVGGNLTLTNVKMFGDTTVVFSGANPTLTCTSGSNNELSAW
ncbi:hypothetical protein LJC27_07370 [Christensenellaceae bacterium OttesenSCG-928-M15]|nr:hypothetical protein [Christensenellaceae bacterium OttesenSCG-928-M15]